VEEIYSGKRFLKRVGEFGKCNEVSKEILKKKLEKNR